MSEAAVHQRIVNSGIVAIVRGVDSDVITDVVRAIAAGGVEAIEITVDTPGAVEMIREVSESASTARTAPSAWSRSSR